MDSADRETVLGLGLELEEDLEPSASSPAKIHDPQPQPHQGLKSCYSFSIARASGRGVAVLVERVSVAVRGGLGAL